MSSTEPVSVHLLDPLPKTERHTNMCDRLRGMQKQDIHNNELVSVAMSRIQDVNANLKIECMVCRENVLRIPSCINGSKSVQLKRQYYHMRGTDGSNLLVVPEHVILLDAGQLIQASYWHDMHSSGMSRGIVSANGGVCGGCYRNANKPDNYSNLMDTMSKDSDVFTRNTTTFLQMKVMMNGFTSIKVNTLCTCSNLETKPCTSCVGNTYHQKTTCNELDLANIFQPMWIRGDAFGTGFEVWIANLHAVDLLYMHNGITDNTREIQSDQGEKMMQVHTFPRYHDKLHSSCFNKCLFSNKHVSCGSCGGGVGVTKIHCFDKFFHMECVQYCYICRMECVPRVGANTTLHNMDPSAMCVRLACSTCWNGTREEPRVVTVGQITVTVVDNNDVKRKCVKRAKVEKIVVQPLVRLSNEDAELPFLRIKGLLPVNSEELSWGV